jgi:hypothetical protein
MSAVLYINDDDTLKKINIDELYEKKKVRDLKQISIFNKILNRIHKRIQTTGRTKKYEKYVWFSVPEYIFGEPLYDRGDCIGYIVQKLEENGFYIRYIHPNTLFISWDNWIPTYVRNEIKKKRGIVIDEKGNVLKENAAGGEDTPNPNNVGGPALPSVTSGGDTTKRFNNISNYKPKGSLVYNPELFERLEKKIEGGNQFLP